MPVLANPRHEAFAQAIVAGLANGQRETYSNGSAYRRAGYLPTNRNSADAAASRLLRRVKPILDRVRKLQAELAEQTGESKEKIIAELNDLKRQASAKEAYGAAVSAVMGKAKILNLDTPRNTKQDIAKPIQCMNWGKDCCGAWGFASPTSFRS